MEVKFINGKKLPGGYNVSGAQAVHFDSPEQMDAFIVALQEANNGSTEPVILPDGTPLRSLSNGEKWFWEQMMGALLWLLLFSGLR